MTPTMMNPLMGMCFMDEETQKTLASMGKTLGGLCRLSYDGSIAISTSKGYKTFDPATKELVGCNNFVFNFGDQIFMLWPANNVKEGDIIYHNDRPKCVLSVERSGKKIISVKAFNYETEEITEFIPKRGMFMKNFCLFKKIISPFSSIVAKNFKGGKGAGFKNIMKNAYRMQMMQGFFNASGMGSMFGGASGMTDGSNNMMQMMMLPMCMKMMGGMFGGTDSDMPDPFSGMFGEEDCDIFDDLDFLDETPETETKEGE